MTDLSEYWTENLWAGHVNHNCRFCAFATLDRATIESHVAAHLAPPEFRPSGLILDSTGAPIGADPDEEDFE